MKTTNISKQEKIAFIINEIRKKIPRLMLPKLGCKVVVENNANIITIGLNGFDITPDNYIINKK